MGASIQAHSLLQNQNGKLFVQDRLKLHPWHYGFGHILPTYVTLTGDVQDGTDADSRLIWCPTMLVQHSDAIRRSHPRIHRLSGYVAASMSLVLALSGLAFTLRKRLFGTELMYSHPNPLHLHRLRIQGWTVLAWPTFEATLYFIGPVQLYSLVRLVRAARSKRYLEHQTWSVTYTIAGFTIALQRVGMVLAAIAANIVHFGLSDRSKRAMGIPIEFGQAQWNAEMADFALTTSLAFVFASFWAIRTFSKGRAVWSQRSKS